MDASVTDKQSLEQRSHVDGHPGLTFFFAYNPNEAVTLLDDDDNDHIDKSVPWTVIGKEWAQKMSGGWWRFLLLGPGPTVTWHEGTLGWIHPVVDPTREVPQ